MARSAQARDRQRQTDAGRYAIMAAEHVLYVEAQLTAAMTYTNGHMLSPAGEIITDERHLWAGRESTARKLASEELRNFWDTHGRLSISQFERQWMADQRAARDAARDAAETSTDDTYYGWGE